MTLRFTLRGFRPPRASLTTAMGTLERRVMNEIWRRGEATVRDVHQSIGKANAYTTIMTTLDRLHRKRLLKRRREGRAFVYSATLSREAFDEAVARDVIGGLLDQGAEPAIACIVDAVSDHDRELLDELERLVREKRRSLRKGE